MTFKRSLKKLGVRHWNNWKKYSDIENAIHSVGVSYRCVGPIVFILLPDDAKMYVEILRDHIYVKTLVKVTIKSYQDTLVALLSYLKEILNLKHCIDECQA